MNTIYLTGRITMDPNNPPETFKGQIYGKLQDGKSFYNNSIAVDTSYKNKETGEWVNKADFFIIRAYGGTADYLYNNVPKGEKIMITGALKNEEWDIGEGKKGRRSYISVQSVEKFIFPKKEDDLSDLPFIDTSEEN